MTKKNRRTRPKNAGITRAADGARQVMREPILRSLLGQSGLTSAQLETLLIDLVVEDAVGTHVPYEEKATARSQGLGSKKPGVTRGAFNRTLSQARTNVIQSIYTMLLLAYLGIFDSNPFRPFQEIASRIGDYRRIREVLAGRADLTVEDLESYKAIEKSILAALDELKSPLVLKSRHSKSRARPDETAPE
jgi:hypothetical protein